MSFRTDTSNIILSQQDALDCLDVGKDEEDVLNEVNSLPESIFSN